jgi:hypothetical protein
MRARLAEARRGEVYAGDSSVLNGISRLSGVRSITVCSGSGKSGREDRWAAESTKMPSSETLGYGLSLFL